MAKITPASGVLNDAASAVQDSFVDGLLDCPHYTRPEEYDGARVPAVLLSGTSNSHADKGFATIDPFTSACALADSDAGKPDGYDTPVHRASTSVSALLWQAPPVFSPTFSAVLERIFPASLARAPPLS